MAENELKAAFGDVSVWEKIASNPLLKKSLEIGLAYQLYKTTLYKKNFTLKIKSLQG